MNRLFGASVWRFGVVGAVGCLLGAILYEILFPAAPAMDVAAAQSVALVIDTSGSMAFDGKLPEVKRAATAFVDRQGDRRTLVALVEFASRAELVSPPTADVAALRDSISRFEANGGTNIAEAIREGARALQGDAGAGRSMLLFTDGQPDVSGESSGQSRARALQEAMLARGGNVKLVAIGTEDADLDFLASLTGSRDLVFSTTSGNFDEAFQRADRKIRQLFEGSGAGSSNWFEALARALALGALVAFALGAALLVAENVWGLRGRWWRDLAWAPLGAALLGVGGALVGQVLFSLFGARTLGWAVLGAAAGSLLGLADRSRAKATRGALGGFVGGLVGGWVFDGLSRALVFGPQDSGVLARLVGFAVLGFAIGLMMQIAQQAFKGAWLTGITTGPYEGKQYILGKPVVTVGRSDGNDIGLYREKTLGLKAGQFRFDRGGWAYSGEAVLVNGSSTTDAALRGGDTVRFGGTEFLFEERGGGSTPPPEAEAASPAPPSTAVSSPPVSSVPISSAPPANLPVASTLETAPARVPPAPPRVPPATADTSRWRLAGEETIELPAAPARVTVGRAADNTLQLDDMSVSSHHALLEVTADGLRVTDLGSTNGVSVGGTRLPPNVPHILKSREYVAFGTQAFFVVEHN